MTIERLLREGTLSPAIKAYIRRNKTLAECLTLAEWKISGVRTNGFDLVHIGNIEIFKLNSKTLTLGDQVGNSGYMYNQKDLVIIDFSAAVAVLRARLNNSSYGIWATKLEELYRNLSKEGDKKCQ
jgi:hypothetical protein